MAKKDVMNETAEMMTTTMSAQVELANKCYNLYQAQAEKAAKFWMETAAQAMADGQKAMKEWTDVATEIAADARKTCEATVKETTKAFTPAG